MASSSVPAPALAPYEADLTLPSARELSPVAPTTATVEVKPDATPACAPFPALSYHADPFMSTVNAGRGDARAPGGETTPSGTAATVDLPLAAPVQPASQAEAPTNDSVPSPVSALSLTRPEQLPVQPDAPEPSPATDIPPQPDSEAARSAQRDVPQDAADLVWPVKMIVWPPTAPSSPENRVPIVLQNENGPCSLLALANILLLTRKISLPSRARYVTYVQLAERIADHLLVRLTEMPPSPTSGSGRAMNLDDALDILPRCRFGLDVNLRFGAVDGFAEDGTGALDLFRLAGVPLLHGWVADADDTETWEAVVTRAGDYDTAVARLVEADELAKGVVLPSTEGDSASTAVKPEEWTDAQHRLVGDALVIRRFLDSTASQLTYPGLFALAGSLPSGQLAALFRNAHLTVIYRRPDDRAQPALFHLVTDATLARAPHVVWEGLTDVDGSDAEFYDSALQPCHLDGDFVGSQMPPSPRRQSQRYPSLDMAEVARRNDPDLLMAAQLQQAEYDADRQRHHERQQRRQQAAPPPPAPVAVHAPIAADSPRPAATKVKAQKDKCSVM